MESSKIVVVGSSYSSAAVFYYLEKALIKTRESCELLLIGDKNYYFIKEMLPHYLSLSCNISDFVQDFRSVILLRPGVSFLNAQILSIDLSKMVIKTSKGDVKYKYLVVAPESDIKSEEVPFENENCFYLQCPSDVYLLHMHILKNIEKAILEKNPASKKLLLTFSVIGGKSYGIEVICSISDMVNNLIKKKYPELNVLFLKFNLFEESNKIGDVDDPYYNIRTFYNLNKKKINIFTNSKITKLDKNLIEVNNEKLIDSGTIICTDATCGSSVIRLFPFESNWIPTNIYMQLDGFDNVFAIGELAKCLDLSEMQHQNVSFYNKQAKTCANNLIAKINSNPMKPLKSILGINFLSCGYKKTMLMFNRFYIDGFIPWLIHRLFLIFNFNGWYKRITAFASFVLFLLGIYDYQLLDIFQPAEKKIMIEK